MTSRLDKLQWYLPAVATIAVIISCIIISAPLIWMAIWVVVACVVFFIMGDCMRCYLRSRVFPPEEKPILDEDDSGLQDAYDVDQPVQAIQATDDEAESGEAVVLEKTLHDDGLFGEEPFADGMLEEELLEEENLEDAFMDSQ